MRLILEEKYHEIADVWVFRFRPETPMQWSPGQFMRFEIPHDKPDAKGIERWFTISSAPYEGVIQITTRISSSTLKQALILNERIDPCHELFIYERLRYVVISTTGEGLGNFLGSVLGRKQKNGNFGDSRWKGSEVPADFDSGDSRHNPVEENQIRSDTR